MTHMPIAANANGITQRNRNRCIRYVSPCIWLVNGAARSGGTSASQPQVLTGRDRVGPKSLEEILEHVPVAETARLKGVTDVSVQLARFSTTFVVRRLT